MSHPVGGGREGFNKAALGNSKRVPPFDLCPGWPDMASSDQSAESMRQLALNIRHAIGGRSIRSVAAECGLSHVTVLNVLNGKSWPDVWTIAHLEQGLKTGLWPAFLAP